MWSQYYLLLGDSYCHYNCSTREKLWKQVHKTTFSKQLCFFVSLLCRNRKQRYKRQKTVIANNTIFCLYGHSHSKLSFDFMLLMTSTQKKMSFSFHHEPFGIWDQTDFVVYKSEGKDKSTLKNKSKT